MAHASDALNLNGVAATGLKLGLTSPTHSPTGDDGCSSHGSDADMDASESHSGLDGTGLGGAADAEGVWSADIEQAFQEALAIYPPCGRRKIILSDEGKMYGRNELIARYIKLRTGKTRTRKQVSSHIQVLARKKSRELQSKLKDSSSREKAIASLSAMSSAQIVSVSMHSKAMAAAAGGFNGLYGSGAFWRTGLSPTAPLTSPLGSLPQELETKPFAHLTAAGYPAAVVAAAASMGQRHPAASLTMGGPLAFPLLPQISGGVNPWECMIATPEIRLCEFSAYVERTIRGQPTRHDLVRIGGPMDSPSELESIDVSLFYEKFPQKGGLKEISDRGPPHAFFLVKFWGDVSYDVSDEPNAMYAIDSRYETSKSHTITISTKVCSFGKEVVQKVETEYPIFEQGRFVYRVTRSPMCEYMVSFVQKLKHLPKREMMNNVLENFSILQVVSNKDTQETLLCIAFMFAVSEAADGCQHHIFKLVRPGEKVL